MSYRVELFDQTGTRIGYAYRGAIKLRPHWYPHPSSARVAGDAVVKRHPELHYFVNKFDKNILERLNTGFLASKHVPV